MQSVDKYVNDEIAEDLQVKDHKYFRGGCWGRYLDIVPQICRYSESVILITGARKTGKSVLVETLVNEMQEGFKVTTLAGNIKSSVEEVMRQIAEGFSLPWDGSDAQSGNDDTRPWVLLVDDANEYAQDIIENLINLSLSNTKDVKLHLVLLANPMFGKLIDRLHLENNIQGKIHNLELDPFEIDETEAFLWYQWHLSGTKTQMPITGDLLVKLQQVSSGIVGNIIEVSKKIIDGKELPSIKPKSGKRRYQIVIGAIVLGVGYIFIGWFLDKSKSNYTQTTINIPKSIDESKLEQPKSITDGVKLSVKATKTEQKSLQGNIRNLTLDDEAAPTTVEKKSLEIITNPKSAPQVISNDIQTSKNISLLVKERIADDKTKNQNDIQTELETTKIAPQHEEKMPADENLIKPPSYIVNVKNLNPQPLAQKVESNLKSDPLKVSNLEPNKILRGVKKVTTTHKKPSSLYSVNENKLLAMSSVKFGWQLVASSQEEKIKDFIRNNNLKDTYYYTSTLNGKAWFVLIYGQFVSKDDANKAIKKLPKTIIDMKPWLRDYESIHSSIIKSKRK